MPLQINPAVAEFHPKVPLIGWNRLSPRPRAKDFEESLQAKVSDPLWFLSRQWQWGEFKGENTGTAVLARTQFKTTKISHVASSDGSVQQYNTTLPLEQQIESLPVFELNLKESVKAGQRWKAMLRQTIPATDYPEVFRQFVEELYPFEVPAEQTSYQPTDTGFMKDARTLADPAHIEVLKNLHNRSVNGYAFILHLLQSGNKASDSLTGVSAVVSDQIDTLGDTFKIWVENTFGLNNPVESWVDDGLEYRFGCVLPNKDENGASVKEVIHAPEFSSGRLDWDAFDKATPETPGVNPGLFNVNLTQEEQDSVIEERIGVYPSGIQFAGMPADRWWEFEDAQLNISNNIPDNTDLLGMMLMEFSLIYANEWNIIPYNVPVGSVTEAEYIIVNDSFGKRILVEPASKAKDDAWDAWGMFHLSQTGEDPSVGVDNRIFIPPVISHSSTETEPTERIRFVRDEMANMVWAVESEIPHFWSGNKDGIEHSLNFNGYIDKLYKNVGGNPHIPLADTDYRYQLMNNNVPDHWIPFIPIKLDQTGKRGSMLQRAAMPRVMGPLGPDEYYPKIRPLSRLLRVGLNPDDEQRQTEPFYLNEEEVPRAGAEVTSAWQRARWMNGKVCNWYSRKKTTGRGEGYSGLAFDQLIKQDNE